MGSGSSLKKMEKKFGEVVIGLEKGPRKVAVLSHKTLAGPHAISAKFTKASNQRVGCLLFPDCF
jgi:hypothetical protein